MGIGRGLTASPFPHHRPYGLPGLSSRWFALAPPPPGRRTQKVNHAVNRLRFHPFDQVCITQGGKTSKEEEGIPCGNHADEHAHADIYRWYQPVQEKTHTETDHQQEYFDQQVDDERPKD